jgi:mitofilin
MDQVKQVSQGDELISACLSTVPLSVLDHGVLTNAQLSARFKLLEPEIRKASLLPPNAGIAGHVGSIIFSKLLWKKEGNPVGNDVESIIARTECALTEGRIVDAVQEINQLKGWPKKLAQDWLDEGRKKSEVEFIVGVLSEQSRLWNITNSTK